MDTSGAKLFTYLGGAGASYQDSAERSVTHTNPIVLDQDSAGSVTHTNPIVLKTNASDHANAVAHALKAQIPGLTIYVDYDIYNSAVTLIGRYACPCGEISGLCQTFYDEDDLPPVELQVERLKRALRVHVREEGNEPNF